MTTTTNADAYLFDEGYEPIIVDAMEISDEAFEGQTPIPLLLLASFDHGLRTADETSWAVGTECVGQVCRAFFVACGIPWCNGWALGNVHEIDWNACAISAELKEPGDWCDSQALYDWCTYEAEPMFSDAGGIVEASSDAGMTWLYIPIS